MKNIARTGLGVFVVLLGAMASVFAVIGVTLCAGGFTLLAQLAEIMIRIKMTFSDEDHWWTSTRHRLGHKLEDLGHELKILH
jgi:hypothetical protein